MTIPYLNVTPSPQHASPDRLAHAHRLAVLTGDVSNVAAVITVLSLSTVLFGGLPFLGLLGTLAFAAVAAGITYVARESFKHHVVAYNELSSNSRTAPATAAQQLSPDAAPLQWTHLVSDRAQNNTRNR